ncbi:hypothetical protein IWX48DRAFT_610833, partial [Phyllosticta citricarpa]
MVHAQTYVYTCILGYRYISVFSVPNHAISSLRYIGQVRFLMFFFFFFFSSVITVLQVARCLWRFHCRRPDHGQSGRRSPPANTTIVPLSSYLCPNVAGTSSVALLMKRSRIQPPPRRSNHIHKSESEGEET